MFQNYFKIANRSFLQNKVYSLVNVLGLSISLAVVLLICLYVKDDFSFDRFHKNGQQIYRLVSNTKDIKGEIIKSGNTGHIQGPIFKEEVSEIESYCRFKNGWNTLVKNGNDVFEEELLYVDSSIFSIFTFDVLAGDPKAALKDINDIVITDKIAQKYFNTIEAIGKVLFVGDGGGELKPFQVKAVVKSLPSNSSIQFDLLCSFDFIEALDEQYSSPQSWANASLNTFVLIGKKADITKVANKLQTVTSKYISQELETVKKENPLATSYEMKFLLQPFYDMHLNPEYFASNGLKYWSDIKYPKIMSGLAILLLVIACINFVNLTLARSLQRSKEIGIRKATGATKWQLFSQFMSEAFLITTAAAIPALFLANALLPSFTDLTNKYFHSSILFSPPSMFIYFGLVILVVLLAGSYPALVMSGFQPINCLKGKATFNTKQRLRQSLVVFQFTMAGVLMIGTAFVTQQFRFINSKPLGYETSDRVRFWLPWDEISKISGDIKSELRKLPHVEMVSSKSGDFNKTKYTIDGEETDWIYYEHIDDQHLQLLKIPLLAGRYFSYKYANDTVSNIIVNEAFVKQILPKVKDPLSTPIKLRNQMTNIVGVVKDFHYSSFKEAIEPMVFLLDKGTQAGMIHVKIKEGYQKESMAAIQGVYKNFVPFIPFEYEMMEDHRLQQYAEELREKQMVTYTASIAIIIACLGLFGLATFITEQRTKEIGIRKVLGAGIYSITRLLSKDFLKLVLISFILALPISFYMTERWLQTFSYRINMSWWVFLCVALISVFIALLSVSYQSIKAALANPVNSLKSE